MLSGLFAWALDLDLIENNPCAGLKKATKEQSRDRVLTEREVSFLLTAIDRLPHPLDRDYVRFLLLSTQRRNEVARMKWDEISEVDLDGRQWLWTIPKGRTKQKREQLLPLSGDMITILEKRRSEGDGRPYVFGARSGKLAPYRDFDRLKIKLDRTITELNNGVQIPQWQLHDFRRTVVSIMGDDLDVDVYVAEKLLAHKGESFKGVADIYQRGKYLKKKKAALEAWADHLQCLRIKARGLEVVG